MSGFLVNERGVFKFLSNGFLSSTLSAMHLYTSKWLSFQILGNFATIWRRVSPFLMMGFLSLIWGRICLQISTWPFFAAKRRGVVPSLFLGFLSLQYPAMYLNTSKRPNLAALWSGVSPFFDLGFLFDKLDEVEWA